MSYQGLSLLLLVTTFTCVCCVNVTFSDCSNATICEIISVSIDPCKEVPKPCKLKKRHDSKIKFEFIPQFNADAAVMAVYWANGNLEPKFDDLDDNACQYTKCGLQTGVMSELNYKLHLSKKLPRGLFPIRWKVWNKEDNSQECCFLTNIAVVP